MTTDGVNAVQHWLGASTQVAEASVYSSYQVDEDWCASVLESYEMDTDTKFPWNVGEGMIIKEKQHLALFLARKHMRNFETTHCTPLPASEFHSPWKL